MKNMRKFLQKVPEKNSEQMDNKIRGSNGQTDARYFIGHQFVAWVQ